MFALSTSAIRASENIQLKLIRYRLRAFQRGINRISPSRHTLQLSPEQVAQKLCFAVLRIKLTFDQ